MKQIEELTAGERALIEKLRSGESFQLAISCGPGANQWAVTRALSLPARDPGTTGGGESFDQAWGQCHR